MKRKLALASIAAWMLIMIGLLIYFNLDEEEDRINIKQASADTLEDMQSVMGQEEELYKWADEEKIGDGGHIHLHNDEVAEKYNTVEGAITFLFSAVTLKDEDLFIQAFEPESLSKDIFNGDSVDNSEVIMDFIQAISKEQEITDINFIQKEGVLGTLKDEAAVKVVYSDHSEAEINLTFKHYSSNNHGDDLSTYLVSTAPSEIVAQIEKDTN
ncbi:hypothetical protein [Terribacillus sp. DMT04]|uniref:hypothetical protein n=1 Tax=Terribacillus sp. DMT04 TaxID=2850441 RepID=UPI001C2C9878|nr:hypothetical protein [Terribacillus sp. DMT04]QXE03603.1 hypothetical protein KS242_17620 [Terribacillus sp. DMT04]